MSTTPPETDQQPEAQLEDFGRFVTHYIADLINNHVFRPGVPKPVGEVSAFDHQAAVLDWLIGWQRIAPEALDKALPGITELSSDESGNPTGKLAEVADEIQAERPPGIFPVIALFVERHEGATRLKRPIPGKEEDSEILWWARGGDAPLGPAETIETDAPSGEPGMTEAPETALPAPLVTDETDMPQLAATPGWKKAIRHIVKMLPNLARGLGWPDSNR